MEQRTDEWHDARKGKMTASRMAEAIGLIGSRRRLWRELTGREGGIRTNARMQDGMDFERIAVAAYEALMNNVTVTPAGFLPHPKHDWIGGSPDGLVEVRSSMNRFLAQGGLEVKCPKEMYLTVPDYYVPQMQGLMEITGRKWWDFVVWTPEATAITRVFRDDLYWEQLYGLLCEFWAYVESDVEPPIFKRGEKPRITAVTKMLPLFRERE